MSSDRHVRAIAVVVVVVLALLCIGTMVASLLIAYTQVQDRFDRGCIAFNDFREAYRDNLRAAQQQRPGEPDETYLDRVADIRRSLDRTDGPTC